MLIKLSYCCLLVGFMQRTRLYLGLDTNSPSTDLKAEVKRLMFSADKEPLVVTTDPGKFTMIMSAFTTYEKQVCTYAL